MVSGRTVTALVGKGAASVEEVGALCGAGTRCGSCRPVLQALIEAQGGLRSEAPEPASGLSRAVPAGRLVGGSQATSAESREPPNFMEARMAEGDPAVVGALNSLLTIELTVINQYFLHSKMCASWGYERLALRFRALSMEEMRDAETYADRILELQGLPNFQRLAAFQIGETPAEQLTLARDSEARALQALREGIEISEEKGDLVTAGLFRGAALEERTHLAWAESQLRLIEQLGETNYLTTQVVA